MWGRMGWVWVGLDWVDGLGWVWVGFLWGGEGREGRGGETVWGGVGTGDGGFWCIARWGGEGRGGEGRWLVKGL